MNKNSLFAVAATLCTLLASCAVDDGITGKFQCLDDHSILPNDKDYTEANCSKDFVCNAVDTPDRYASSDDRYYLCYRCTNPDTHYKNGSCEQITCQDSEYSCSDNKLMKCENGERVTVETCKSEERCNAEQAACINNVPQATCEDGKYTCDGQDLIKCINGQPELEKTCGTNEVCNAASQECSVIPNGAECVDDLYSCKENTLYRCKNGQFDKIQACTDSERCNTETGNCDAKCSEGIYTCSENQLSLCTKGKNTVVKTCTSTQTCDADAGKCIDNETQTTCEENSYSCDGQKLMKCTKGAQTLDKTCTSHEICDAGKKTCSLDLDGDGTPDDADACPFNPKYQKSSGNSTCQPFENGTFTIYNPYNLYDLAAILNDKSADYTFAKASISGTIKTVVLANDINFADYASISDYAAQLADISNTECKVLHWEHIQTLENITLDGQKHKISAKTADGISCEFPQGLINQIDSSTVKDLILDYSINGNTDGMLANYVNNTGSTSTIENITFSGRLQSTSTDTVGGLIGEVPAGTIINNIWTEDIEVIADKAECTGGLIGKAAPNSMSLSDKVYRIKKVQGSNNVGGLFGMHTSMSTQNPVQTRFIVDEVSGNNNVGGFAGVTSGPMTNVIGIVDKVSGSENVGGFAGSTHNTSPYPEISSNIAIQSTLISGTQSVGGFIGNATYHIITQPTISQFKQILNIAENVNGQEAVGGFVGSSMPLVSFDSINSRTKLVTGTNKIAGFAGSLQSLTRAWSNISSTANVSAKDESGNPAGLIGYFETPLTTFSLTNIVSSTKRFAGSNNHPDHAAVYYTQNLIDKQTEQMVTNELYYYADSKDSTQSGFVSTMNSFFSAFTDSQVTTIAKALAISQKLDNAAWDTATYPLYTSYNPDNKANPTEEMTVPMLIIPQLEKDLADLQKIK